MSITREELKEFAGFSSLKDVRTLNEMVLDLLTDAQIKQIEDFFEKSLSLKPKPRQKKKEVKREEPKQKTQREQMRPDHMDMDEPVKKDEQVATEKDVGDDVVDEDIFKPEDDAMIDDLDEFEFDTDTLKNTKEDVTEEKVEHKRTLSQEEIDAMERDFTKRQAQRD